SVELHDKVIGHYLNIKHYQQVGVITLWMFYWSYSLVWPIVPLFQYDKPRPVEKPDSTFKKVYKKQYVVI
ncbi:hypothetical protein U4Z67_13205, partial [Escherichia coli]|nr:hypothetical protein [Escherichia coli]